MIQICILDFPFTISGMGEITTNLTLEECKDAKSALNTYSVMATIMMLNKEPWLRKCPIPCKQKSYHLTLAKFHQNTIPTENPAQDFKPESFEFTMFYDDFVVEKVSESLRYDILEFLAQAGGNLGLFLGLSCLTVGYAVIEYLENFDYGRVFRRLRIMLL